MHSIVAKHLKITKSKIMFVDQDVVLQELLLQKNASSLLTLMFWNTFLSPSLFFVAQKKTWIFADVCFFITSPQRYQPDLFVFDHQLGILKISTSNETDASWNASRHLNMSQLCKKHPYKVGPYDRRKWSSYNIYNSYV